MLLVLQVGTVHAEPHQRQGPNILWITIEDITTFLSGYGNRDVRTPNIDRLAAEGVRYAHAYQVSGVCAPSRSALITGMYPTSVGTFHHRTGPGELSISGVTASEKPKGVPEKYAVVLPPQVKAFPEYLRKAGYYTSNNQKTDYQFEAPVTVWDENGPAASYRHRPKDKPFFAVFNFFLTHESMVTFRKDALLEAPSSISVPPIYPDTPAVRNDMARMYTNIVLMDRQVGEPLPRPAQKQLSPWETPQVLAQRLERRPKLFGKELRLFPGSEVAALVRFVEVDQIAIGTPGPGFRWAIDVFWKYRHRHGQRNHSLRFGDGNAG